MPFQRFSSPTVRISDVFRFEANLSGAHWESLLETISRDFFKGAAYHLQLQTTGGDKYLRLHPGEWHYFVAEQRERLWFLSLDIHSGKGEYMKLELDFHPLVNGPNANIEVLSPRADLLIQRMKETIGVAEEALPVSSLHETFSFSQEILDINFIDHCIRQLSRELLQRTPPVAFLSTKSGKSYTGLSLFQLKKVMELHQDELDVLSIGVTRPMSGQTLSLMFEFSPEYTAPFASLNLIWGEEIQHQEIRDRLVFLFGLQQRPGLESWQGEGKFCTVSLQWRTASSGLLWETIDSTLRNQGWDPQPLKSQHAHQAWDDTINAMHKASLFVIDISEQSPESLYQAGFAKASGKPVVLLSRDQSAVPSSLHDIPVLLYEHSLLGREMLGNALGLALKEVGA